MQPQRTSGISTVNKPMKILGIYFTYDWQKYQELNFREYHQVYQKSYQSLELEKPNISWTNTDNQDVRNA